MNRTEELRDQGALDRNAPRTKDAAQTAREGQAKDNLTAILSEDPFELVEMLRDAGARKAKAQAVAYRLERERKALLARLSGEYARTHAKESMSETKLERLARADERYQKHIEGTAAAIEEKELAGSEYWALRTRLEWLRAAVAHENALARIE